MTKKEKVNKGSTLLIPKSEWVPEKEIQGNDEMVLTHPVMKKAFNKILQLHEMKHKIAFVSLCTSTRPYSKSLKWKNFKERYGDYADMIICSNGGIIPIEFEECYPYLTYDAHGEKKYDELYVRYVYARLKIFFEKFPYEYIIFNFRHNLRNVRSARALRKKSKHPENIFIAPSKKTYMMAKKNNFKPYSGYYPDLSHEVINELDGIFKEIERREKRKGVRK